MNAALERSIQKYVADLRRYARTLAGRAGDADELVQECLVRAIAGTRLWTRIRDPRAYLFAIMHNVYVDWLASRRRQQSYIELQLAVRAGDSCTEAQMIAVETKDLERALSYLPNEQREVVLMVGLEGMSYQQAADALDIPVGTVMSRLSRGRATLRHLTDGKKCMPALPTSVTPVRRSHLRVV